MQTFSAVRPTSNNQTVTATTGSGGTAIPITGETVRIVSTGTVFVSFGDQYVTTTPATGVMILTGKEFYAICGNRAGSGRFTHVAIVAESASCTVNLANVLM